MRASAAAVAPTAEATAPPPGVGVRAASASRKSAMVYEARGCMGCGGECRGVRRGGMEGVEAQMRVKDVGAWLATDLPRGRVHGSGTSCAMMHAGKIRARSIPHGGHNPFK